MSLKCGIVGLPNVGKSTLFNALTQTSKAQAANYPFCTIEPNVGVVAVPDERILALAKLSNAKEVIPAHMEFVDIAGLVKGASQGEGLGNKFLSHIRQVSAILHVLRCFEDGNITHVHGQIDPVHDKEIIETELIISDLEIVEKRLSAIEKRFNSGDKSLAAECEALREARCILDQGQPLRSAKNSNFDAIKSLQLITIKPVLYVCNVIEREAKSGNELTKKIAEMAAAEGAGSVIISSKIEEEISMLAAEDREDFLKDLGLEEAGLEKIIKASYSLLGLESFFTAGEKEVHCWTYPRGATAEQAAGIIHTDFAKGFIRAEVISYKDYIACKGERGAKEAGKMRLEGRDYKVQDGDVMHFRFNV